MRSDVGFFLRAWMSNPLTVASITPSSRALARLMTSEISQQTGPLIELGPGTGAFTRALLDRGVKECDLTLIESGPDFARMLDSRFPQARVLQMDAAELAQAALYAGPTVGAVVSGLPFLSMPHQKVVAILSGAFSYLRDGAGFYQFTYGPRCPVPRSVLSQLKLDATRIGRALTNIPPAVVYRITRRGLAEPQPAV